MGVAKKQGRRVGHVLRGQRVGGDGRTLLPNPSEVAILEEIRWLRAREDLRRAEREGPAESRRVASSNRVTSASCSKDTAMGLHCGVRR
jgi:hypothetical protein